MSSIVQNSKRLVLKIGTALVKNNDGKGLDPLQVGKFAAQIAELHKSGKEIVLIAPGATAEGMHRLGIETRPEVLAERQACAAIGQMGLTHAYGSAFGEQGMRSAQLLLTRREVNDEEQWLVTGDALCRLLQSNVIPIIAQNDAIALREIMIGDSDWLAALTAELVNADALVILTDQKGLFTADPRTNPDAQWVREGKAGDPALEAMAVIPGGDWHGLHGMGGMHTKLISAKRAGEAGVGTVIASGYEENVLVRLAQGEAIGTYLAAQPVQPRQDGSVSSVWTSLANKLGMRKDAGPKSKN